MSLHTTGHTKLLCLLGSPVEHSISPEMHNEACALLGLDYHYLAFDVPLDRLETAVAGLKAMGVKGFNLTMPGWWRCATSSPPPPKSAVLSILSSTTTVD